MNDLSVIPVSNSRPIIQEGKCKESKISFCVALTLQFSASSHHLPLTSSSSSASSASSAFSLDSDIDENEIYLETPRFDNFPRDKVSNLNNYYMNLDNGKELCKNVKEIFNPVKRHTIDITKKTTQSEPFK